MAEAARLTGSQRAGYPALLARVAEVIHSEARSLDRRNPVELAVERRNLRDSQVLH